MFLSFFHDNLLNITISSFVLCIAGAVYYDEADTNNYSITRKSAAIANRIAAAVKV